MTTLTRSYLQVANDCYKCGISFMMPEWFDQECHNRGWTFYCPQGHGQVYSKTEVTKLREELERAKARETFLRDQRDAADRRTSAMKGQVTKIKKRIGKGVCPCCNRHFANVDRHMASKHPDYSDSESDATA